MLVKMQYLGMGGTGLSILKKLKYCDLHSFQIPTYELLAKGKYYSKRTNRKWEYGFIKLGTVKIIEKLNNQGVIINSNSRRCEMAVIDAVVKEFNMKPKDLLKESLKTYLEKGLSKVEADIF